LELPFSPHTFADNKKKQDGDQGTESQSAETTGATPVPVGANSMHTGTLVVQCYFIFCVTMKTTITDLFHLLFVTMKQPKFEPHFLLKYRTFSQSILEKIINQHVTHVVCVEGLAVGGSGRRAIKARIRPGVHSPGIRKQESQGLIRHCACSQLIDGYMNGYQLKFQ
jgi:hypothetical protein